MRAIRRGGGDCTERVDVDGVDCMMALVIGEMTERQ